jgi:ketosteroid isomerase-like protein
MGEQENREVVERLFELNQRGDADGIFELYDEAAVIEFPQSGERIEGSKNALEVLRNYPEGTPSFTPRRIRAAGDLVIAEADGRYPDGSTWSLVSIREIKDGRVVHEIDYFGQEFEAPEWRAQWITKL